MNAKIKAGKLSRLVRLALVIMMTIGLFPALGFSGTYTIFATDIASVFATLPTDYSTYFYTCGSTGGCEAFLKFDLSSIPAKQIITGFTLGALCDRVDPDGGVVDELYAVADNSWTHTSITWANKPASGALLANTNTTVGWNQWAFSPAGLPTTGQTTFMMKLAAGTEGRFWSNENPNPTTIQPYLLVTTAVNMEPIKFLLILE
jgi:hypothetical protein